MTFEHLNRRSNITEEYFEARITYMNLNQTNVTPKYDSKWLEFAGRDPTLEAKQIEYEGAEKD